jgi:sulfite reductase beta subunit-like hemoprotein
MSSAKQDHCPGVLRLHDAADGLLARVRLPGGRLSASALAAVAAAAELGNGIIELTSRASLQLRGLRDPALATEILADAGLLPTRSHERARNILASPLAGRHPLSQLNPDTVVDALDQALCSDDSLVDLSGRFLFGVDDGSGMLAHPVDVLIGPGGSVEAALKAARRGATGFITGALPTPGPALPLGPLVQSDRLVALTFMPPLARLDPTGARALAGLASGFRLSVRRTLTVLDIDPSQVPSLTRQLNALGLVTDPRSGWVGLTACAGLGACRRAQFDVRIAAARRAEQRDAAAGAEHWAACERNCGLIPGARLMGTR